MQSIWSAKKGLAGRPKIRQSGKLGDFAEARRKAEAPPPEPEAQAQPLARASSGEDFQAAAPADTHGLRVIEGGGSPDAARAAAPAGGGKPIVVSEGKGGTGSREPSRSPLTPPAGESVAAPGAKPQAEGPRGTAPQEPAAANDIAKTTAPPAPAAESPPGAVQNAVPLDPKARRVAELRQVRTRNEEQISALQAKRQSHEERRLKYEKQAEKIRETTRNRNDPELQKKLRQMNNEATLRDGVQDEIAHTIGANDRINREISDILRPPAANPQQAGRDMETLITQQSGFPKNNIKHSTSFPDPSAPDGARIPDFMPEPDGRGGWKSAARPEDALCVADSKLVDGTLRLTEQIKGFTELAQRTQLKTLWFITGSATLIHPDIYQFANKYSVRVFVTRQP